MFLKKQEHLKLYTFQSRISEAKNSHRNWFTQETTKRATM